MDKKITTYFLKQIRTKRRAIYTYDEDNYYLVDGYMLCKVPKKEMELNIIFRIN